MAEILTWNYEYKTTDQPWSVVVVEDKQHLLRYLKSDSIIILDSETFDYNIEFFAAIKLASYSTQIFVHNAKICDDYFFTSFSENEIECLVRKTIIKKFVLIDIKDHIIKLYKYLKIEE